jgi:hypothetical protein
MIIPLRRKHLQNHYLPNKFAPNLLRSAILIQMSHVNLESPVPLGSERSMRLLLTQLRIQDLRLLYLPTGSHQAMNHPHFMRLPTPLMQTIGGKL